MIGRTPSSSRAFETSEELLSTRLKDLAAKHRLAGERDHGLLRALDLARRAASAVVEAARDLVRDGLLLHAPRPNLLRSMPALNVEATEIEVMMERLDDLPSFMRASSAESRH